MVLPFISNKYTFTVGKKIQIELMHYFDIKPNIAQKMLDRLRVFDEWGKPLKKGDVLQSPIVEIVEFMGFSRGLKPIFSNEDFAIFDKPNDLLVHPVHRFTPYSLLDEVKWHFGQDANIVNRIDSETSGLILISKNKYSEKELKVKFENKEYEKTYLAIICGKLEKEILIDKPLDNDKKSKIRVKMGCFENGRLSQTFVTPLATKSDFTLVKVIPYTGRQHQIRVHLSSIDYPILGDPIYNADEDFADKYLNKEITQEERIKHTGDARMWLHSNNLRFSYKKLNYDFQSISRDIFEKFDSI